jgi:hypothetical protein
LENPGISKMGKFRDFGNFFPEFSKFKKSENFSENFCVFKTSVQQCTHIKISVKLIEIGFSEKIPKMSQDVSEI